MKSTLKTAAEYRAAYRGKRLRGKYFTLVLTDSSDFRYGVVVRKAVGNSVERNRIKRVVRDVVLDARAERTFLVLAGDNASGVSNGLLRADLEALLGRVK